jgi:phosphomethylpyrimidine synthase
MADFDPKIDLAPQGGPRPAGELTVTTGPIRGSRKVHVGALGVKMR